MKAVLSEATQMPYLFNLLQYARQENVQNIK